MNYEKIYANLINKAKNRILDGYKETHHIIPRCMNGTDDKENLVDLTPEEHYVAHQLLVKIYPNEHCLINAAAMMIPKRPSNKMYGWLRRKFSINKSLEQTGVGNSQYGTKWISNLETKVSRKIRKTDDVPEGWVIGRNVWNKNNKKIKKHSNDLRDKKLQQEKERYEEYYEIYNQYGFDKFLQLTNYPYSKQNLVQRFKKLITNFKAQNGKKRG